MRRTKRESAPIAIAWRLGLWHSDGRRHHQWLGPVASMRLMRTWRRALATRQFGRVLYLCSPRALPYVKRAIARIPSAGAIEVAPLASRPRLASAAAQRLYEVISYPLIVIKAAGCRNIVSRYCNEPSDLFECSAFAD